MRKTHEWMCSMAREIEAATQALCQGGWGQPLSHSATLAGWVEQPLSWLSGWSSHSYHTG